MVIPRLVAQALAGEPITVDGDGNQSRCFGHVDAAVDCLDHLLRTPAAAGEVVNVGNDREIRIGRPAELIREIAGSDSPIDRVPYAEVLARGFEDMPRRVPDVGKLCRLIGTRPRTPIERIVADVVAHQRGETATRRPSALAS